MMDQTRVLFCVFNQGLQIESFPYGLQHSETQSSDMEEEGGKTQSGSGGEYYSSNSLKVLYYP